MGSPQNRHHKIDTKIWDEKPLADNKDNQIRCHNIIYCVGYMVVRENGKPLISFHHLRNMLLHLSKETPDRKKVL